MQHVNWKRFSITRMDLTYIPAALLLIISLVFCETGLLIPFFSIIALVCLLLFVALTIYYVSRMQHSPFLLLPLLTSVWYTLPVSYYFLIPDKVKLNFDASVMYESAVNINLICMVSYCIGFFTKVRMSTLDVQLSKRFDNIILYVALTACLQIYVILKGDWNYALAGATSESTNPIRLLAATAALPMLPLCGVYLATLIKARAKFYSRYVILIIACALNFYWVFISGRRALAFAILFAIVMFFAKFFRGRKIQVKDFGYVAAALIIAAVGINMASKAYYTIRLSGWNEQGSGKQDVEIDKLGQNIASIDSRVADQSFEDNVYQRPYIIDTYMVVQNTGRGYLGGLGLLASFEAAVPRALFPSKKSSELVQESLWSKYLFVADNDWANTILIDSYADIGPVGFPVYLAIIYMFAIALVRLSETLGLTLLPLIVSLSTVVISLQVEISLSGYIGWFRNLLFIIVLYGAAIILNNFVRKKRITLR